MGFSFSQGKLVLFLGKMKIPWEISVPKLALRGYSDSDCQSCFIILSTSYTSKFHYTNSDTRSVPSKTIFNVVEVI
jgi:hypothetical protein